MNPLAKLNTSVCVCRSIEMRKVSSVAVIVVVVVVAVVVVVVAYYNSFFEWHLNFIRQITFSIVQTYFLLNVELLFATFCP